MLMGMIGDKVPAAVAWNPNTSGAAFWVDASDNATVHATGGLSDGNPVTQWDDKSLNGRNLTVVGSHANPTYLTSAQNGLPGILMVAGTGGIDDQNAVLGTGNFSIPAGTLFMVAFKTDAGFPEQGYSLALTAPTAQNIYVRNNNVGSVPAFGSTNTISMGGSALGASTAEWAYAGSAASPANAVGRRSSGTEQSGDQGDAAAGTTGLTLCASGFAGFGLGAYILEAFLIPAYTSGDKTNAIAYIGNKWGLPNT